VQVKAPEEILQTLDVNGTVDKLPFMPEMMEYCGKTFRVARRIVKTCSWAKSSTMRTFRSDDVLLLEGMRCAGTEHDGCQKACTIFWRESWLRRAEVSVPASESHELGRAQLRAHLKTSVDARTYFCQASELLRATEPLSQWGRIEKCVSEVRAGNCTVLEMAERIAIWLYWRTRRIFLGEYAHGTNSSTPVESLNLQAGELVEIKSMEKINETLTPTGHNRGLYFSPDLSLLCGKQRRVERRIDKMIMDGSGEMRKLHNTVYLEGGFCGCAHVAFGGCGRCEFSYWREIWLRHRTGSS
jgi:hypothetical protein